MNNLSLPREHAISKSNSLDLLYPFQFDRKCAPQYGTCKKIKKGHSRGQKIVGKSSNNLSTNQKINSIMNKIDTKETVRKKLKSLEFFAPVVKTFMPVPKYTSNFSRNVFHKNIERHNGKEETFVNSYSFPNPQGKYNTFKNNPFYSKNVTSPKTKKSPKYSSITNRTTISRRHPGNQRSPVLPIAKLSTLTATPQGTVFWSLEKLNIDKNDSSIVKLQKIWDDSKEQSNIDDRSLEPILQKSECNSQRPTTSSFTRNSSKSSKMSSPQDKYKISNEKQISKRNDKEQVDTKKKKIEVKEKSPKKQLQKNNLKSHTLNSVNIEYLNNIIPVRCREKINPQLIGSLPFYVRNSFFKHEEREKLQQSTAKIKRTGLRNRNEDPKILNSKVPKKPKGKKSCPYQSFTNENSITITTDEIDAVQEGPNNENHSIYRPANSKKYFVEQNNTLFGHEETEYDLCKINQDPEIEPTKKGNISKSKGRCQMESANDEKFISNRREVEATSEDMPDKIDMIIEKLGDLDGFGNDTESPDFHQAFRWLKRGYFTMSEKNSALGGPSKTQLCGDKEESSESTSKTYQFKVETGKNVQIVANVEESLPGDISNASEWGVASRTHITSEFTRDNKFHDENYENTGSIGIDLSCHEINEHRTDSSEDEKSICLAPPTSRINIAKVSSQQQISRDIDENIKTLKDAMDFMKNIRSNAKSQQLIHRLSGEDIVSSNNKWKSCPMITNESENSPYTSIVSRSEELKTPNSISLQKDSNFILEENCNIEEENPDNFQNASSEILDTGMDTANTMLNSMKSSITTEVGGFSNCLNVIIDDISKTIDLSNEISSDEFERSQLDELYFPENYPETRRRNKLSIIVETSGRKNLWEVFPENWNELKDLETDIE